MNAAGDNTVVTNDAASPPTETPVAAPESATESASVPEVLNAEAEGMGTTVAATDHSDHQHSHEAPAATSEELVEPVRRVELNPTANVEAMKPVATYAGETVGGGDAISATFVPSGPVDIPRATETNLDSALEAEIEAAMKGSSNTAPAAEAAHDTHHDSHGSVTANITSEDQLEPGMRLKAKVQSVSEENVFVDLGLRSPGILSSRQFPQGKQPRAGEEFLVVVDKVDLEQGLVHVALPKGTRKAKGNWEELHAGMVVECYVTKSNKGGLDVAISNMRAFLPASQVELGFVPSLETYVGKKFPVKIMEVNPAKRNLVVSRKAILIEERKELATTFWQQVEVGQQYPGSVKTIKDYGVFVDLGGVDGFLHIGEMAWTRIKHPSDILAEGSQVEVVVLSLDREKQKIGLGMRQLKENPWANAVQTYPIGQPASGKVSRVTEFGAFVELEPGVEGLIHISELDYRRVKKVTEVLNVGQEVQCQVLEVQPERQRISLSLKALKPKPEEPKDEDLSPSKGAAFDKKRKEPLKGGTGDPNAPTRGGLFGDPGTFGAR